MNRRPRISPPRRLAFGLVCLLNVFALPPPLARAADPLAGAWDKASGYLFNEAYEDFRAAEGKAGVDERERSYGEGLTLLSIQPRTQGHIERALELFQKVSAQDDGGRLSLLARFFSARVYEMHLETPQFEKAAAIYRDLVGRRTGNPVIESSAEKLVMLEAYGKLTPAERANRLAALEPLADLLVSPAGKRGFHGAMGAAYLDLGQLDKGIAHLVEADQQSYTRWQSESAAWLAIAEAARQADNKPLAIAYYRKYFDKYQRDAKHALVGERLHALESSPPTPP